MIFDYYHTTKSYWSVSQALIWFLYHIACVINVFNVQVVQIVWTTWTTSSSNSVMKSYEHIFQYCWLLSHIYMYAVCIYTYGLVLYILHPLHHLPLSSLIHTNTQTHTHTHTHTHTGRLVLNQILDILSCYYNFFNRLIRCH